MLTAAACYVYAGGFSVGVERAGFDVLCHMEGDNGYGVADAKLNWPDRPIYFGPSRWPMKELSDFGVDFVYANPPCAIFSAMGIRTTRGADGWRTDPRLDHWWDSFRALEQIRPKAWALESVTQAYTTGRGVVDEMTKRALMMGYSVTHLFISAMNHGIPQDRKRFFIVAHRQPKFKPFPLNYAPPPTCGEAMAEVDDPGEYTPLNENHRLALRECQPGERLCNAWMRLNPNFDENRNDRGQVIGRPSFQDRRLDPKEVMGAFLGDKFFHWEHERLLGVNEMKALCGYPLDFKLAPPQRGWPSMLARAVMPPVGEWLARSVALTLADGDGAWSDRRVTHVDTRRQGIEPQNLTSQYLENGRVRIRVRADGSWTSSTGVTVSQDRVESIGASVVPAAAFIAPQPAPAVTAELSSVAALSPSFPAASVPQPPVHSFLPPESVLVPSPRVSTPVPVGVASVPAGQLPAENAPPRPNDHDFADPQYAKRPGEGSGVFMQRLWMDTELSPDYICSLVHQNWAGRTTQVGDVRYNYYKLAEQATTGPDGVMRLADGRVVRPWPTVGRRKRETARAPSPRTAPAAGGTPETNVPPTIVPSGPLANGSTPPGELSALGLAAMQSEQAKGYGPPPAEPTTGGWNKARVAPEYRGHLKRAMLYYSQLPAPGSVAAPISSARIAWFLQENLQFDRVYHSNDYPTDVLPESIDDLWVVNSSWFYNKDEWRKIAMRLFRRAKRVIFCQNDYAMVISSYQLGAMREDTEYVLLTTCLDLPIQQKHGLKPIHVNWNVLTYQPRPKTDAERRDGIYYYGSLRAGRTGVFDKYFTNPSPVLTVSASSPNDVNQFRERWPNLTNVVGRADRGVVEELETWAATLILEDKRSIESFVSPPNRFYEALSARCPMVFDPDSIPMWRRYGYDVEPFVVHGPADLPRVLEVAGEFGAAQEEWQRDYLGELTTRFWEVVPTMTGRRGAPETLKRYTLHEDGGEW